MVEILLVRHAPISVKGVLAGRTDFDCDLPATPAPWVVDLFSTPRMVSSPALRCVKTAQFLKPSFGAGAFDTDDRLWEQDFGQWDGAKFADIPDLGPLTRQQTAQFSPPNGESFVDVVARIRPVLAEICELDDQVAVVAHAGIIRACLSVALGADDGGLAFEIAPLSLTRLRFGAGAWSVGCVNQAL